MKKYIIAILFSISIMVCYAQENVAPNGSITSSTNFQNPDNTIDEIYTNYATLPSGYSTGAVEITLDKSYVISDIYVITNATIDDDITIYVANGGAYQNVGTFDVSQFPVSVDQYVEKIKVYTNKYSSSTVLNILEIQAYESSKCISFNYDASGNRTSRTIEFEALKSGRIAEQTDPYEEQTGEGTIKIFPNPTEGQLSVKLIDFESLENARIQIFDLTGKRVYDNVRISHNNFIDISDVAIGTYVMKIKVGETINEWKIIKK